MKKKTKGIIHDHAWPDLNGKRAEFMRYGNGGIMYLRLLEAGAPVGEAGRTIHKKGEVVMLGLGRFEPVVQDEQAA